MRDMEKEMGKNKLDINKEILTGSIFIDMT